MERMKKKEYRRIICTQTDMIKELKAKNEALKTYSKRNKLRIIGGLCDLSNELTDECMIPESEVVKMCIEVVKKAYER